MSVAFTTTANSHPNMSHPPTNAKINPRRSSDRGHADHGWLNTYHTFSFAHYHDPAHTSHGPLRVLNEDRVAPNSGFPTHPHRDAEIFSYVLSGELTHRDSMVRKGHEDSEPESDDDDVDDDDKNRKAKTPAQSLSQISKKGTAAAAASTPKKKRDDFYRMHRSDVQFTTGGTGIAHSEFNESPTTPVHFLQIWVTPWKRGLTPRYHTETFPEDRKRAGFVTILSPLKAGPGASEQDEEEARPSVEGTIPIHADFVMGAGLMAPGKRFEWVVGGLDAEGKEATRWKTRRLYVHLAMTKGGKAKVRLEGQEGSVVLKEGDGAYVFQVERGQGFGVESVGEEEAEVVLMDIN